MMAETSSCFTIQKFFSQHLFPPNSSRDCYCLIVLVAYYWIRKVRGICGLRC